MAISPNTMNQIFNTTATQSQIGIHQPVRIPFNRVEIPKFDGTARTVFHSVPGGVDMGAGAQSPKLFGIDMDGDGHYNAQKDGVLSLDLNGDGKHNPIRTNNVLRVFAGAGSDLNRDGKVTKREEQRFSRLLAKGKALDQNKDGTLDASELKKAGAKVTRQTLGPIDNLVTEDLTEEAFSPQHQYLGGETGWNPYPQPLFFGTGFPISPFSFPYSFFGGWPFQF